MTATCSHKTSLFFLFFTVANYIVYNCFIFCKFIISVSASSATIKQCIYKTHTQRSYTRSQFNL